MPKVYEITGTVFQRNEWMAGTELYETSYDIEESHHQIISEKDATEIESDIRAKYPNREGKVFAQLRDLKVTYICAFTWKSDGSLPLCGNDPASGEHWVWFGNHEEGCPFTSQS